MNQKGVTLIELMMVVVVLSIIFGISFVVVTKLLDKNEKSAYNISVSSIESAGESYMLENRELLPNETSKTYEIPLNTLVENGYIDEVVDTTKDKPIKGKVKVIYEMEDTYQYRFVITP